MPDLVTIGSAAAKYGPTLLPLAGGLYEKLFGGDDGILDEVLEEQHALQRMQARQARGIFTPAEQQNIQRANEPQVNMVASNVAARGLDKSGAGAEIVAQAQRAPFRAAQQTASTLHQATLFNTFKMVRQLELDDKAFYNDLATIAGNLRKLNEPDDTDGDDSTKSSSKTDVEAAFKMLLNLADAGSKLFSFLNSTETSGGSEGIIGPDIGKIGEFDSQINY